MKWEVNIQAGGCYRAAAHFPAGKTEAGETGHVLEVAEYG